MDQNFYIPRNNYAPGNPWGAAANAYGNELDRLGSLQQQGYQQMAQIPNTIYDRFMQGYQQKMAEQRQQQQFDVDSSFKNAQIAHLGMQNQEIESKMKAQQRAMDARVASGKWITASMKPDGTVDTGKYALGMASDGYGQDAADHLAAFLKNQKDSQEIVTARQKSMDAANDHAARIAYGGVAGENPNPGEALKSLKGLIDGNPQTYGHIKIPDAIWVSPPQVQTDYLKNLVRIATPVEKQAPKTDIKANNGMNTVISTDPLFGGATAGQTLGLAEGSLDAGTKIKLNVQQGLLTPQEGQERMRKLDYIAPSAIVVQQQAANDPRMAAVWDMEARAAIKNGKINQIYARDPSARNAIALRMTEIDPGADLAENGIVTRNREKSIKYFTTGAGANAFRQQDIIQKHADSLEGLYTALDNNDMVAANKFANALGVQLGRDKATNYNIGNHILSQEIGKYLAGGTSTGNERTKFEELQGAFMSPGQQRGALKTLKTFVAGQHEVWKAQRAAALRGDMPFMDSDASPAPGGGGSPQTQVNPANGKTYYLHPDGKYYLQPPLQ